jgi:hypothetical protein
MGCPFKENVHARTCSPSGISSMVVYLTQPILVPTTFCWPRGGGFTWPEAGFFFGAGHSRVKWPIRSQLKQLWEVAPATGGAGRRNTCGGGGRAFSATCWYEC